jgi:hypothetical protein
LPIDMPKHDAISGIKAQDVRAELLRRAVLLLWDEVSMVPLAALDCVDRLLRDLTGDPRPFGGKVLVLGGDFRQLLPVVPGANEPELIANTILHHYSVQEGYMCRFSLTSNMRLRHGSGGEDISHRDWLLQLGSGRLPVVTDLHQHAIELPEHLCMPSGASVEHFIAWIFPDVRKRVQLCLTGGDVEQHDAWFRSRAILTSRNDVALQVNTLILASLDPATEYLALSLDSIVDSGSGDSTNFPVEFLNSLTPSGLPPHKLRFRVGAVVIVLRNLDKERGICNGCRCFVLAVSMRMLDVRILTGRSAGKRYLLPRIPFRSGASEFPFILRRRQFPVRLAWAMSIHKAQGQTLIQCGVLLPEPVFTHGQLYVCASRSSSANGLRLWLGDPIDGHGYHEEVATGKKIPHTLNIVFPAVLSMHPPGDGPVATVALPSPCTTTVPKDGEVDAAVEFVDLSETQQSSLHKTLHTACVTAPVESGAADLELGASATSPALADLHLRADLLGFSPSEWFELSQRPVAYIEVLLENEERRNAPGASSST